MLVPLTTISAQFDSCSCLRWPNTVFARAFADAIQRAHKDECFIPMKETFQTQVFNNYSVENGICFPSLFWYFIEKLNIDFVVPLNTFFAQVF